MEKIEIGLMLALVGMTTVFIVLALLIILGKYLILFINRFIPEEADNAPAKAVDAIPANVQAVVAETVKVLTGGKGTVSKIEKI